MKANRFERLKEILLKAADLSETERRRYFDDACRDDPELRKEAESILAHEADASGILRTGGARSEGDLDPPPSGDEAETIDPAASPGETLGLYILRERIGSGGMGEVWRAEQTTPVRRTVALKLIKAGMDSRQVIARFEAERQALALMDHPAIAKVFDAGTTPQGRPYFAMEYVPGVPITDYCDARKLGTQERLELFQRVCEGVQHAHQKAVIHRDLKPSNIIVSDVDGKPHPRIIDFGVAKATIQKLTEKTMYTAMGQLIGTPEYMSPEQADLTAEDIDTRTDVYSLGAILYELLAGALPFEATELRRAGFEGIIRLLREKDPPRPSTKVSSLGERTTEVAANRRTEPRRLASQLRGDLDWIVMRSLEKDRNRRYASPQELAQDIERHLSHEPVLAGPPSVVYRSKKFIRRHRVGVGVTATMGLAVVLAFVLVTAQNARIAAARDEAELVTATLEEMLASVDPTKSGRDVTVKEMLDATAKTLGEKFQDQPMIEARLRHTVGNTYWALGEYSVAEEHLAKAVEIRREFSGEEALPTLEAMTDLAWAYEQLGRYEEAEALFQKVLRQRVHGQENANTVECMSGLASAYKDLRHYDEAESILRETLEVSRRVNGEEDPRNMGAMSNLARVCLIQGRYSESESLLRQVLDVYHGISRDDDPVALFAKYSLADVLRARGRLDEAEAISREALEDNRRVLGETHPQTLWAMESLALTYHAQTRFDEAEALRREILAIRRRILGEDHPKTLDAMARLSGTYRAQGHLADAEALLREILEIRRRTYGEGDPLTLDTSSQLAYMVGYQGRFAEAESLMRKTLEISRRALGENNRTTSTQYYHVACILALQGRRDEAIAFLREACDHGHRHPDVLDDPDLASLHGDPEFEAIVKELGQRNEDTEPATVE